MGFGDGGHSDRSGSVAPSKSCDSNRGSKGSRQTWRSKRLGPTLSLQSVKQKLTPLKPFGIHAETVTLSDPRDLTLENPPRPPLLRGRFGIDLTSIRRLIRHRRFDPKSMPNRPLRRAGRGGFEGGVQGGLCLN